MRREGPNLRKVDVDDTWQFLPMEGDKWLVDYKTGNTTGSRDQRGKEDQANMFLLIKAT